MNFNATLIGQSITFIFFVWFCMEVRVDADHECARNAQEADRRRPGRGPIAGKHELELAAKKAGDNMRDAKATGRRSDRRPG